jgi:hypothetical protein
MLGQVVVLEEVASHVARSVIIITLPRTAGIKVTVPKVGIFLVDAAAR